MSAGKIIKKCMVDKGIKSGTLAEKLGDNKQVFYNKLYRDSMKFSEVERIAEALGCEIVFKDKETGKIY